MKEKKTKSNSKEEEKTSDKPKAAEKVNDENKSVNLEYKGKQTKAGLPD